MFKNLMLYRFPLPWNLTLSEVNENLSNHVFHPCGSQDYASTGWVPPCPDSGLVHSVGGQWLLSLMVQQRLLPSAVINQEVSERANRLAAEQGYPPVRKAIRELKEQVIQEFLPRALLQSRTIKVWIDPKNGWLGVDAPSFSRADIVIEALKKSMMPLPIFISTQRSSASVMADWLLDEEAPDGFSLDRDCELKSGDQEKSTVRYTRLDLNSEQEEIRAHLSAGRLPTRLALTWDDRISFVLTDRMEIKRLSFLDLLKASVDQMATNTDEVCDAEFAVMTGEFQRFIPAVIQCLGGEKHHG